MANLAKGNGLKPIIVFRNHAERTMELLYTPAAHEQFDRDDDVYDFVQSPQNCLVHEYRNTGSGYEHAPEVRTLKPTADVNGFINAVIGSKLDQSVKHSVVSHHSMLKENLRSPKEFSAQFQFLCATLPKAAKELEKIGHEFNLPIKQ